MDCGGMRCRTRTGRCLAVTFGLAAGSALALGLWGCDRSERPGHPNVIVILVDALRGDALGVNGYPLDTTPNLDRLVREGAVNFRRAYAHSTWTKPSIASLFTSLYPSRHGIHLVASEGEGAALLAQSLDQRFTTLAEAFQAAGYQTGAVINQVHLRRSGFEQGFDEYTSLSGKGAGRLNRRLFQWLDGIDPERPFFAYLHYLDTHWPYDSRRPSRGRDFGPVDLDPEPPTAGKRAQRWAAGFDEAGLRPLRARYDSEVAFIDERVAGVRAALEARGWADDTILLVTSDHGEGFLEHGEIQHGFAPYAEVAHVPLILRLPPMLQPPVTDIDAPVGLVDIMPTLLELAAIEPPAGLQGRSLVPLLRGRKPRLEPVYSNGAGAVAVRVPRYTLLRFADRVELFDALGDPAERRPLAACEADCQRLVGQAELYARQLAAMDEARPEVELSAEDVEELRQLGYL